MVETPGSYRHLLSGDALRALAASFGPADLAAEATMAAWKASGEPCLWCWAGDEAKYVPEAEGVLHVLVDGEGHLRTLAGCAGGRAGKGPSGG